MANTLSDRLATSVAQFYSTIDSDASRDYANIARVVTTQTPSLKVALTKDGGSAGFASWDGSDVTPTAIVAAGGSAITPVAYSKAITIGMYEDADNPDLVIEMGVRLAQQASEKIRQLVWAKVAGIKTADHPIIASKLVADAFTTPVNQTNKGTSALSLSALSAARAVMRGYKSHDGDLVPMGSMMLVVPSALETTARQLVGSAFYPNTNTNGGESALINTFQAGNVDSGIAGVQVCPYLTDANDWMLLQTMESYRAVQLWYRDPIQLITSVDPASKAIRLHCSFRAVGFYAPECDAGVFLSAVT